mmetsp:Transcript_10990/g.31122  ORF Transcript_10990/g.31122 Transcript_10990/m.31122 type:complete len:791 (+) Transcript_10990:77-2449(+)
MGCGASSTSPAEKASPPPGTNKEVDKQSAKEQNREYASTMQFISKVPLFKRIPKDEHPLLAQAFNVVDFTPGTTVIAQGDAGDAFFVIKSGEANVLVDNTQVAKLKTGDYFGENSLLRNDPRTATIKAASDLSTLKISRDQFQNLGLVDKIQFPTRKAVAGGVGVGTGARKQEPCEKPQDVANLIGKALQNNQNISELVELSETLIKRLVTAAWSEEIKPNTEVIEEGDIAADYFYIVQTGRFEVLVKDTGEADAGSAEAKLMGGDSQRVNTLAAGACFGELALLYSVPRAATIKATEASTVWVIARQDFKDILKATTSKTEEYLKHVRKVEILSPLLEEEKKAVAEALVEVQLQKNEEIITQGADGTTFYILIEGEVSVVKDGAQQSTLKAGADEAKIFGERALLESAPRGATVVVTSNTAKCLALDKADFELLLCPLKDIIAANDVQASKGRASMAGTTAKKAGAMAAGAQVNRKDLVRIGLLGCGGFGAVELWEHKTTKDTYAMKALSKGYVVRTGMQESVMNEKSILCMTNSPFIIKLFATYNGAQSLYFLMEAALGGELYATYNRKCFHGKETHAKFYSAGVVFAFEHLHERRIIYRDLKPENLLLSEHGHIKLTDMGLAKFVIGKTYTTCGTPDYFAPELIASTGHTIAVDWWTLGILIFELMSGRPPFESAYPMQIYSKVMKGISKVTFPPVCQDKVGELIKSLLKKEPSERLPMKTGGTQNIKDHKWFSGFQWDKMGALELPPPYVPVVKGKNDIANFSARKEDMPRQIEYKDDGSGWDKNF